MVHPLIRKAMNKVVFANYGLIDHKHDTGDGCDAFRALLSNQEDEGLEESSLPALCCGNRMISDGVDRSMTLPHLEVIWE